MRAKKRIVISEVAAKQRIVISEVAGDSHLFMHSQLVLSNAARGGEHLEADVALVGRHHLRYRVQELLIVLVQVCGV